MARVVRTVLFLREAVFGRVARFVATNHPFQQYYRHMTPTSLGSSVAASFHYLALAIGTGAIFMRGHYLRGLAKEPGSAQSIRMLFVADNLWGIAALLWLSTGLIRVLAGFEKGTDYYLHNGMFWVKMGFFGIVGALEIYPMSTFIRWRVKGGKPTAAEVSRRVKTFVRINDVELALVLLIPFVASLMARGIGY